MKQQQQHPPPPPPPPPPPTTSRVRSSEPTRRTAFWHETEPSPKLASALVPRRGGNLSYSWGNFAPSPNYVTLAPKQWREVFFFFFFFLTGLELSCRLQVEAVRSPEPNIKVCSIRINFSAHNNPWVLTGRQCRGETSWLNGPGLKISEECGGVGVNSIRAWGKKKKEKKTLQRLPVIGHQYRFNSHDSGSEEKRFFFFFSFGTKVSRHTDRRPPNQLSGHAVISWFKLLLLLLPRSPPPSRHH